MSNERNYNNKINWSNPLIEASKSCIQRVTHQILIALVVALYCHTSLANRLFLSFDDMLAHAAEFRIHFFQLHGS